MKRFYLSAIASLTESNRELADDIESYVRYVEHERSVLVSEISRNRSLAGNLLLNRLGYKTHNKAVKLEEDKHVVPKYWCCGAEFGEHEESCHNFRDGGEQK